MIFNIDGLSEQDRVFIAQAIRNDQLAKGCGVLLIPENFDGEVINLVEKIVKGGISASAENEDGTYDVDKITWKKTPTILLTAVSCDKTLQDIEIAFPGFKAKHGPIRKVELK